MKLPVKQKTQFSLFYLFIALTVLFVVQGWLVAPRAIEIPLSKFLSLVREGKVEKVSLTEREIRGTLKPGALPTPPPGPGDKLRTLLGSESGPTIFTTTRIPAMDDSQLVKELEAAKVEFSGRVESTFWRDLIFGWVLPLGNHGRALDLPDAADGRRSDPGAVLRPIEGQDLRPEGAEDDVRGRGRRGRGQGRARRGGGLPDEPEEVPAPGRPHPQGRACWWARRARERRSWLGRSRARPTCRSSSCRAPSSSRCSWASGASRVRDLFEQAKEKAPCIVFIDELDAIGKTRAGSTGFLSGHDEREQTLNQLLAEMDGFDSSKGVIIMAATNRPEVLDPALLRAGRFDRQVVVDKPDVKGREAILRVHARNVTLAPSVDLHVLAARTPGMAGADLANIINEAALLAARKGKDAVDMADLDEAVDRVIGGLERKSRVLSEKERDIVAHHEIGHALVASSLPQADPVHKVTIIPRGVGALGATYQLPLEDRYLLTKSELEDRIAVLLGGRVAEEVVYGEISTGAHNDLERATEMARLMITQYGMSEKLGPMTFGGGPQSMFLKGAGLSSDREFSDETALAIDNETRAIIDKIYDRVRDLVSTRKAVLMIAAAELKQRETLEGDRLRELLAGGPSGG